jgi:uncharacterized protein (TIRG00374 family)
LTTKLKAISRTDLIKLAVGLGVTGVLCWFLARSLSWAEIKRAFASADKGLLALAVASMALSYLLRGFRWATILRLADAPGGFWGDTARQQVGNMLNNVLPFRLGDVYRITASAKGGGTVLRAGIGLVVEKLVDVALVLIMGALALLLGPASLRERLIPADLLVLLVSPWLWALGAFGLAVALIAAFVLRAQLMRLIVIVLDRLGLTTLKDARPSAFALVIALGAGAWVFEAFAYALSLSAFGVEAPLALSFVLATGIALSTILPSSPGYIGVYHYTVILIAGPFASSIGPADLSVALHAVIWGSINLFGLVAGLALSIQTIATRFKEQEAPAP